MHTYTHLSQTSSVAIVAPTLSRQALPVLCFAFCVGGGDGSDGCALMPKREREIDAGLYAEVTVRLQDIATRSSVECRVTKNRLLSDEGDVCARVNVRSLRPTLWSKRSRKRRTRKARAIESPHNLKVLGIPIGTGGAGPEKFKTI